MTDEKTDIHFASVAATFVDFSKLDLSPWGIKGGLVKDTETKRFIVSISLEGEAESNWEVIKKKSQEAEGGVGLHGDWENINLLWPIDLNNPPAESDFFEAIEALRIAHPSELFIKNIFEAVYYKGKGICLSSWSTYTSHEWNKYENPRDHYFNYPAEYLDETNCFLAFFKNNYDKRDYISNAIRYYSDSFRVNSPEMAFICLCICLETIVHGKEQLSYKFRRNLAVLCSESAEKGKRIFQNAKKLYGFRSSLVHAGMSKKDFEKFDLFFEYAQILASRMIIEMLLHDIPSIEDLDKKITELGFGQRNEISEKYTDFKVNINTWHRVSGYVFD